MKIFQLLNYKLDKKKKVKKEKKRKGWKVTEYIYQIAIIHESLFNFLFSVIRLFFLSLLRWIIIDILIGIKLHRFNFSRRFHKQLLNESQNYAINARIDKWNDNIWFLNCWKWIFWNIAGKFIRRKNIISHVPRVKEYFFNPIHVKWEIQIVDY